MGPGPDVAMEIPTAARVVGGVKAWVHGTAVSTSGKPYAPSVAPQAVSCFIVPGLHQATERCTGE
jgi:hypothetical protein